jgi:hypothetical protein
LRQATHVSSLPCNARPSHFHSASPIANVLGDSSISDSYSPPLHIRTQRSRTVTWRGKADGHNGAHIDAGDDTAALRAKLAVSGKEVRLVRQFEDGTYLVVAKSGKGLTFLEPDHVFKWMGQGNTDSDIEGLVVQVPTGRCGGSKFSADPTMKNALLHKNVKKFDVSLLYGVPSLFLSAKHIALWPSRIKMYKL